MDGSCDARTTSSVRQMLDIVSTIVDIVSTVVDIVMTIVNVMYIHAAV